MKKIIDFFKEARSELDKISWPTREEITSYTWIVILSVIVMALFLWVVDFSIMKFVKLVVR